ncbi:MAG: glycosyltransferase, partial [Thermoleophilaceae bacterium]|nr:glycosyltransferase [Thermoleophilaceae bacterium]
MSKRVLAVAQSAELGGAERALLRVAAHLPEHGFEVELTVPAEGDLSAAAELPVHRLQIGAVERGDWPRAALAIPAAQRLASKLGPDLVWLNGLVSQRAAPGLWGR